MKLEKREITLNEADSIQDVVLAEKWLLFSYAQSFERVRQKHLRNELLQLTIQSCKDLCQACDLLSANVEEDE